MMNDTSGPAFPTLIRKDEKYMDEAGYGRVRNVATNEPGLSVRDYFAAKAMQGLIPQNHEQLCEWLDEVPEGCDGQTNNILAKVSYDIADAMIKARDAT